MNSLVEPEKLRRRKQQHQPDHNDGQRGSKPLVPEAERRLVNVIQQQIAGIVGAPRVMIIR